WGVPIPIFHCEDCGEYIVNDDTIHHLQQVFREHGSSAWFGMETEQLLPKNYACPKCGGRQFRRETDTMDVWFDSGSSSFSVLENKEHWPDLSAPADLYLEGSDQHRGWFNSSLLISMANRGLPPYRQVLTHGFLVDEEGKKQSKSLGNTISPQEIIKDMGADVLRLWVSSTDYRSDIANSHGIFKQMGESYRKIRNTVRYLLGNLFDFADMPKLDRWAMIKLNRLTAKVLTAYEEYEFHVVYHSIHNFCVLDMSAFYLDVVKDTLYTEKPDSLQRRSVQTVLYHMLDSLTRLLTPILAYTTEEIYSYMPKTADSPLSVQLLDMPMVDSAISDPLLEEQWEKMLVYRDVIAKELEIARRNKLIGHSLDAAVTITANEEAYQILSGFCDDLSRLLIVSQVTLRPSGQVGEELTVVVAAANGQKCARCWIYSDTVGEDSCHPQLCHRCSEVLGK
ncbi:MAG: class I tRNA ligase family protein, partial [Clostridiales bacterium]